MAALTSDVVIKHQEDARIIALPAAVDIFYQGALCMVNASGYAEPCTPTASTFFAGIVATHVDNSGGSAGDVNVLLFVSGLHLLTPSGAAITDVVGKVYAETDNHADCSLASGSPTTSAHMVGNGVRLEGSNLWVDIYVGHLLQELAT